MDLSYDFGKYEVLFVKIGAMVLNLQRHRSFAKGLGPKLPQTSFRPQTSNVHSFEIQIFFHVKLHKILHKASTYFQILGHF